MVPKHKFLYSFCLLFGDSNNFRNLCEGLK
ncbi:hypothetical protein E2C01_060501 [Portunus trituberculatus]|uniref:Uncharacterized protein n=1 Tax=Portunus trituberculatus TaxID=210409 RepID=A0A5B7HC97_PORTR|nr:hypothetical protein [Portunus trituberculatus]